VSVAPQEPQGGHDEHETREGRQPHDLWRAPQETGGGVQTMAACNQQDAELTAAPRRGQRLPPRREHNTERDEGHNNSEGIEPARHALSLPHSRSHGRAVPPQARAGRRPEHTSGSPPTGDSTHLAGSQFTPAELMS